MDISFRNYITYAKHRKTSGGGVALLVHKRWYSIPVRCNLIGEHVAVKIIDLCSHCRSANKKNEIFASVYLPNRPQFMDNDDLSHFDNFIKFDIRSVFIQINM